MPRGAKKKTAKTLDRERLLRLGTHLRDAALHAYVRCNPLHDDVRWKAVPEFGVEAWVAIAEEAIRQGWRPPLEEKKDDPPSA